MITLPPALDPLAAFDQFVCWIAVPHPEKPGKFNKFPVDWRSGSVCDAHDPANWTSVHAAGAIAASYDRGHGAGVGFVFTERDPFFFLDIDGAWDGNAWSPMAGQLAARFAGAAREVSHSRAGLHIIGRAAPIAHGTRCRSHGLELYTARRFVALTGLDAVGDAGHDCTEVLSAIVSELFPPAVVAVTGAGEWTTGPVLGFGGPTDDADLIAKASKPSKAAAFGGKIAFSDLWAGNVPADRRSEADQSLATHLAFWTGKNCERMESLMRRSGLVRDKWDSPSHRNYLRNTILKACAFVTDLATGSQTVTLAEPSLTAAELAPSTASDWRVWFDGQEPSKPSKELIKGLLPSEGVCFIGGQSGAGKTFIGVDLAVALSSAASDGSSSYCRHRITERVGAVIIAAEGEATLANRIEVSKQQHVISHDIPLAFIGGTFDLSASADRSRLQSVLKKISAKFTASGVRLGVLIIDTMAAAFNIEDENSNSECARAISYLREISYNMSGVVIAVHHYGKSQDSGLRGGSALRAGADAIISVLADRNELTGSVNNRRLLLSKSRSADEGMIAKFDLQYTLLGVDDDGDQYGACAVIYDCSTSLSASVKHRRAGKYDDMFRAVVDETLRSCGQVRPELTGSPALLAVCLSTVRSEFAKRFHTANPNIEQKVDAARKPFKRALENLSAEFTTFTGSDGKEWILRIA